MNKSKEILKMSESLFKSKRLKESFINMSDAGWQVEEYLQNAVLDMLGSYGLNGIRGARAINQFKRNGENFIIDAINKGRCNLTLEMVSQIDWADWLEKILYDVENDPDLYDQYDF